MKDPFWIIEAMFMCVRALETVESCNPGFENMGKGKHGKRGEHGKDGKTWNTQFMIQNTLFVNQMTQNILFYSIYCDS